ncbi:hypothetical protein TI05_02785 [Achromatium sp. WMS3]|nr:hypothetical protein TI05_02785 [Achromatium sp. WMS3]
MRTSLNLDDDIIKITKELAQREKISIGQLISRLLREMLLQGSKCSEDVKNAAGFRPFTNGKQLVNNQQVNALREEDGI